MRVLWLLHEVLWGIHRVLWGFHEVFPALPCSALMLRRQSVMFDLVWFCIIWCLTILQICYHVKSGACSFKIIRVMPILVYFGLLWFGLVIFWFGLIWFWIIWCVTIVQICYHAKSGACSFKNDRVMPILVKFGLVWHGPHGLVWFELSIRVVWLLHEVLWGIHEVLWGFHEVFPALPCSALMLRREWVSESVSQWRT